MAFRNSPTAKSRRIRKPAVRKVQLFSNIRNKWRLFSSAALKLPWTQIASVFLLNALFAITIWFSQLTFVTPETPTSDSKGLHLPFSSGISVLRLLQGATSLCTTSCVAQALELIQWTLSNQSHGLRMLSFLSLAPSTKNQGLLKYLYNKVPRLHERGWAVMRFKSPNTRLRENPIY
jgi:hypothetical protein